MQFTFSKIHFRELNTLVTKHAKKKH